MPCPDPLETYKFWLSVITLLGGAVGGLIVYVSFRRSEKWKQAEFLAKVMKDFFDDDLVKKTLQLIDYGSRRIQLLPDYEEDKGRIKVNRRLQAKALRPHTIPGELSSTAGLVEDSSGSYKQKFDDAEIAIRDCYTRFLDGLQTLENYIHSELFDVEALRPFLEYYLIDIQSETKSPADAAWKAALLTFIDFYRYKKVQELFQKFGCDITPDGKRYYEFLNLMEDQKYASLLKESIKAA